MVSVGAQKPVGGSSGRSRASTPGRKPKGRETASQGRRGANDANPLSELKLWDKGGWREAVGDLERVARSGRVGTPDALRILWDAGLVGAECERLERDVRDALASSSSTSYSAGFAEGAALASKRASRSMGFRDSYWESMEGKGKR